VGLFDWLGRGRRGPSVGNPAVTWQVTAEGGEVVADDGRGTWFRASLQGAESVRIVPLSAGSHHSVASGWQVALARKDGDALLGKPLADWQAARALATLVCQKTGLPLHELTERMFSRVGQFAPPQN
jgi:hypothetical protein